MLPNLLWRISTKKISAFRYTFCEHPITKVFHIGLIFKWENIPYLFYIKAINTLYTTIKASLVAQRLKHLPAMWETWVRSLGRKDPLEKEKATHSSILAWRIPWTKEPGRLQSVGSQRVRHDWETSLSFLSFSLSFCTAIKRITHSLLFKKTMGLLCDWIINEKK